MKKRTLILVTMLMFALLLATISVVSAKPGIQHPDGRGGAVTALTVTGMSCGAAVRKALEQVPGVLPVVGVNRSNNGAVGDGNPDHRTLIAAAENEGHEA